MDEIKKAMLRAAGLNEEVDAVEEKKCPFCKEPIKMEDFKDDLSRKEFGISGICQSCQDGVFG